jgi:hypothetical protein
MANLYSQFTYDANTNLRTKASLTASADGDILDLGPGLFDGFLVLDVDSVEIATGDEYYTINLEGSTVAAMTSTSECLGKAHFGKLVVPQDANRTAAGRYVIPIRNEVNGTLMRYVRLSSVVAGTIDTTGMVFGAFLAKR